MNHQQLTNVMSHSLLPSSMTSIADRYGNVSLVNNSFDQQQVDKSHRSLQIMKIATKLKSE